MKNLSVIVGRTLVAMTLVVATPAWGQSPQPSTAQTFLSDGKAAAEAEQWEKAAKLFAQSFQLEPLPKTAGHLGRALIKSGELVSGANQLEYFLHEEQQPSKMADAARELLTTIKPQIGTVAFKLDPQQLPVEAFIDGQRIEDKRLTWPLHLLPGEHSFEFKKDGCTPLTLRGKYAAGEPQVVQAKLDCAKKGNGQGNGNGQQGKVGNGGGMPPLAIAGFAVGGGLLVTSAITGIVANVASQNAHDAAVGAVHGTGCKTDSVCKPIYDEQYGRATTTSIVALASLGAGIGVSVAALMYTLNASKASDAASTPKTSWNIVPTPGGIVLRGAW